MVRHTLEALESRLLLATVRPDLNVIGQEVEPNDSIETATPLSHIAIGMPCHLEATAANFTCPPEVYRGSGAIGGRAIAGPDVDYFTFEAPAGGRVSLRVEGPAVQRGTAIELVAADETVLAHAEFHDSDGDGKPDYASLEHSLRAGGDLYVRLRSAAVIPDTGLDYRIGLSVQTDRNAEQEPNDSFETANEVHLISAALDPVNTNSIPAAVPPLTAFGFVHGELGNGSSSPDNDYFQFSARPSLEVEVHVTGLGAEAGELTIYDASHTVVGTGARDATGDLIVSFTASAEGPYFAQLADTGTIVCITTPCVTYILQVKEHLVFVDPFAEHEPNDTIDTATPLQPSPSPNQIMGDPAAVAADTGSNGADAIFCIDCGVPDRAATYMAHGDLSGTGENQPDKDYFSFEAAANRNIIAALRTDGAVHVQLLDAAGNVLDDKSTASSRSNGLDRSIDVFTRDGGKFYLLVEPADSVPLAGGDTGYSVHVAVRSEPNVEHEPNDSIDAANPIALRPALVHCDLNCVQPLASNSGDTQPLATGTADAASLPIARFDDRLAGFIVGNADVQPCPANAICSQPLLAGDDFFSVATDAGRHLRAELSGPLLRLGGELTLFGADGATITSDADASNGLSVEWDALDAATFYLSVRVSDSGLATPGGIPCVSTAATGCRDATQYRLDVVSGRIVNPIEGVDEHEPNDAIETANTIELRVLPTVAPGIGLRGATARGVAGGPTADQDFFRIDVHAGEHVTVGAAGLVRDGGVPIPIDLWLRAHNLNEFGDAAGTVYRRGLPNDFGPALDRIDYILSHHPQIGLTRFDVTIHDSGGNTVGTTSGTDHFGVSFDAAADSTYYIQVAAKQASAADVSGHYWLGVLARSQFDRELVDPVNPEPGQPGEPPVAAEPAVVVVKAGQLFRYTDSTGDAVELRLTGKAGTATVTFADSTADGSDIVSVEIAGVKRGGSFSVQTDGSANVGSIELHGFGTLGRRRGASRSGDFGSVRVDGNVGKIVSDLNLRSVVVDGMLGGLTATGRQIREVHAGVFDTAMADVGSIRTLDVDKAGTDELFESFLPWEPPVL